MNNSPSLLESLVSQTEEQVSELLKRYERDKAELRTLRAENEALRKNLAEKEQALEHFQYQTKISKIVELLTAETDPPDQLREKIDTFIRDLDLCISYLKQQ